MVNTYGLKDLGVQGSSRILLGKTVWQCKRIAYACGLEVDEITYRIIEINGASTIYDTTKTTGYWLKDDAGNTALIQIDRDGWCLVIPNALFCEL